MAAGDWPTDLEAAFLDRLDAATVDPAGGGAPVALGMNGVLRNRIDHEPEKFTGRSFPAVTLFAIQAPDDDIETGLATRVAWTWRLNLYVGLQGGYKDAQNELKTLWPLLLRAVRLDPSLGVDGAWARLSDPGGEPEFNHEEKFLVKTLRLEIERLES